jgi:hypothetical protein
MSSSAPPLDTRFSAALAADDPQAEAAACRTLESLPALVNADPWLVHRARFLTAGCLIQVGRVPYHLTIAAGRIAALERGARPLTAWSFAIRATARGWTEFWQPVPEPKWHDLFALTRYGEAVVEGNLLPLLQNLQAVKDMLAAPRRAAPHPHAGKP